MEEEMDVAIFPNDNLEYNSSSDFEGPLLKKKSPTEEWNTNSWNVMLWSVHLDLNTAVKSVLTKSQTSHFSKTSPRHLVLTQESFESSLIPDIVPAFF